MNRALAALRRTGPPAAARPKAVARRAAKPRGLRLVDAVALAAGGLLVLKLIGLMMEGRPQDSFSSAPPFAQTLVHARSGYEPPDPVTTGATTPKEEPKADPKADPKAASPPPAEPAPKPPGPTSPSERALLERLGERREALQTRNRDLDVRERLIENAEKRLENRIGELKSAEERLEGGAAKRGETEGAALKNLVTMYEAMKPKDAARVFDRLPLEVLVPVVLGIAPRKMAEVMGLMSPEAAEKLTVALANRARGLADPRTATAAALPPNELPAVEPGR